MKKRWEIEEKDTWRLEDMVESDARWEEFFAQAKEEIGGIRAVPGLPGRVGGYAVRMPGL